MLRKSLCTALLLLAAGSARAADPSGKTAAPAAPKAGDTKELSGMSIVGNDDAPKALVIVPWKSSAMGSALDVSRALDDGRQPVDKEVFVRELDYYGIRAESSGASGSGAR
jgi:hypothetical protein